MIDHSPTAFTHEQFCNTITQVTNQNLLYKGILFYLEEEPHMLNDLLRVVTSKIDNAKLIN